MKLSGGMITAVVLLAASPANSDKIFSYPESRQDQFQRQLDFLESRGGTAFAMPQSHAKPVKSARTQGKPVAAKRRLHGRDIAAYITEARRTAERHAIPEALFLALIQQESGWNKRARSSVGAIGLTQLMPGTAKYLRVDPHDPLQNLEGGARYLREQYLTFGDWRLALAAYNAGPGAVKKYGGVPPYVETRNYIKRILGG